MGERRCVVCAHQLDVVELDGLPGGHAKERSGAEPKGALHGGLELAVWGVGLGQHAQVDDVLQGKELPLRPHSPADHAQEEKRGRGEEEQRDEGFLLRWQCARLLSMILFNHGHSTIPQR